eukprot:COSAG02_NODE_9069_length_2342_cov_38.444490_2_plen_27_part_01
MFYFGQRFLTLHVDFPPSQSEKLKKTR